MWATLGPKNRNCAIMENKEKPADDAAGFEVARQAGQGEIKCAGAYSPPPPLLLAPEASSMALASAMSDFGTALWMYSR